MKKGYLKPKTDPLCDTCGDTFHRYTTFQKDCLPCTVAQVQKDRKKKEAKAVKVKKQEDREFKKKFRDKDRPWHIKTLQTEFNKFIRLRDAKEPCISCQRFHEGQIHAGHYRTIGANPELRFEEDNCFAQCSACNNHLSGNLINYRINLLRKIGISRLTWLEGPHAPKKYTIPELKDLIAAYRQKNKELTKCKE